MGHFPLFYFYFIKFANKENHLFHPKLTSGLTEMARCKNYSCILKSNATQLLHSEIFLIVWLVRNLIASVINQTFHCESFRRVKGQGWYWEQDIECSCSRCLTFFFWPHLFWSKPQAWHFTCKHYRKFFFQKSIFLLCNHAIDIMKIWKLNSSFYNGMS